VQYKNGQAVSHKTLWTRSIFVICLSLLLAAPQLSLASDKFSWGYDPLFQRLERNFVAFQQVSADEAREEAARLFNRGEKILQKIAASDDSASNDQLEKLIKLQFRIATLAAAHPSILTDARDFIRQSRLTVSKVARTWPITEADTHELIYKVIYGGRAAIEEALVQAADQSIPALHPLEEAESQTPSVVINGVRIHSGDLLLSRGGAPTSALIARGNHFPGQFSHIAMVYVDAETKEPLVIESLIEDGVVITSAEEYLNRDSLRIMVLRLRPDTLLLQSNPMAPHEAASYMLKKAQSNKLPYDFARAWKDDAGSFWSEVVYHAYQSIGIDLWAYKGEVTAPGLKRWLGQLGVKHFTMIIPSDIEYDPRLAHVAEWIKADTLKEDRYDNAILDVLLETAETGYDLSYEWYKYPAGSVVKGWSAFSNLFGAKSKIPKGMSTDTSLRVHSLTNRIHPTLKEALRQKAADFKMDNNYEPPYWELLAMTRQALGEHMKELSQVLRK
jgi:hypothetical protein